MMEKRTRIKELLATGQTGALVMVKGRVRTVRAGKGVTFLALNDGSCFAHLQVVAEPDLANYGEISRLGTGAALAVSGRLVESPASGQRYELQAAAIAIVGLADESYPLQKKRHSFE